MNYCDSGDLNNYLANKFYDISWNEKLWIVNDIVDGLVNIHKLNIIHRDLHSGNILLNSANIMSKCSKEAVLCDLGISKSALESTEDKIYGIINYMDPEVFKNRTYTIASDIYSLGMVMWELMTGRRPFWDRVHDDDDELILEICDGLRPPIVTNAPKGYIELMKECWHSDPEKRPKAIEIRKKLKEIKKGEWDTTTKIIKSLDIGPVDSETIYKSRCLSDIIPMSLRSQSTTSEFDSASFQEKDKRKYENNCENDYKSEDLNFDI
ncbi:kinase-like domain-containing protein [Glomus cerebriforme]|uniref:Kinase-like domain-containing protein n=1 Tax=Glomus cerebriforme TaxID=658196 RepID=A0A397TCL6_9GLOM|nr:kinase-like domain-containing protein [Glomus cerebriforme]